MPNLQLVTLDYPLLTLNNNCSTGKYLSDLIKYKQLGFSQTSDSYIVMDKHDMIGTHFMIYDTTNVHEPKLVLAIRNTYEERTIKHGVSLPVFGYIDLAGPRARSLFNQLHSEVGMLVDCNSWFVDPEYSFKKTGLRLSEIAFLMVATFILRRGQDHFVAATNERFKASRWLSLAGRFPEGLEFVHPAVPDLHKVELVRNLDHQWVLKAMTEYGALMHSAFEIIGTPSEVLSLDEALANLNNIAPQPVSA